MGIIEKIKGGKMRKLFILSMLGVLFYGCGVNHPPVIKNITVTPSTVETETQITIMVQADDEDNDPLTYEWKWVEKDSIFPTTGSSLTWTTPSEPGTYHFYIKVDDGRGGIADTTYAINVTRPVLEVHLYQPDSIGTRSVFLAWTPVTASSFARYEILQAKTPDASGELICTKEGVGARYDTTYKVTSLLPGTDYYFTVVAVDSQGNRYPSNKVKVTTLLYIDIGEHPLGGHGLRIASHSQQPYIYVAAREAGVAAFSVSTADAPTYISSYISTPHWAMDVANYSNYLYVAFNDDGLHILDVSSPATFTLLSIVDTATILGNAVCVVAGANRVYVGWEHSGTYGITIIDVTNKTSPQVLDTALLKDRPNDLWINGGYLYVACNNSGLAIMDVSTDVVNTDDIIYYTTNDAANALYITGSLLYLAASSEGLRIFDISNPFAPKDAGQWKTGEDDARGVYVWSQPAGKDWACVANGEYGLRVIDLSEKQIFLDANFGDEVYDVWAQTVPGKDVEEIAAYMACWNSNFKAIKW